MNVRLLPAGAAMAALLASLLSSCHIAKPGEVQAAAGESADSLRDPLAVRIQSEYLSKVRVGEPSWSFVAATLSVPGHIEADETRLTRAGSPVAGRVLELTAVEGQSVKRGEVLATLNSTELSEGQFGFLKAQAQMQLAQQAAARAKHLLEAGVIGAAELQRRESELAQCTAEFATWHDRLRLLGMPAEAIEHLEQTRSVNSRSQVVASIEGVVLERKVTIGQVVQPADTLYVIADLSHVWLMADIPEQSAGLIRAGKNIEAEVPALPGRTIRGQLSFVSAIVHPDTRTVRVRMDLPNPGLLFKPAMLANVRLQDQPDRRKVVPSGAVVREGNQDHVFVQTAPDTFLLRQVSLGEELQNRRVLLDGIGDGERIVIDGAFHVNNERKRASLHGE